MNPEVEARFWPNVNKGPGCWTWTGGCTNAGYGQFKVSGVMYLAHRVSLELFLGRPILPRMVVAHAPHSICGHRNCVKPAHLSEKTHAQNQADKIADGTSTRGTRSANSKLTEAEVLAIRSDTRLYRVIAAEYGIRQRTVSHIKLRTSWAWLEDAQAESTSLE